MFRRDERPSVSGSGAIRFPRHPKGETPAFDIASMLSVGIVFALFLILLFLYGAPSGVALDTPTSENAAPIPIPDWKVAIDPSGALYFENRVIDRADLTTTLSARLKNDPDATNVLLFLDRSVRIDQFSSVGAALRDLGLSVYYHVRQRRAEIPGIRPADQ